MSKPLDDPEATPEDVLRVLKNPPEGREAEATLKLAIIDAAAAAGGKAATRFLIENGDIDRSEARDVDDFDNNEKKAVRLFIIAAFQSLVKSMTRG